MEFGIKSEQLHESVSVSTPIGESIMAVRVYRDYVVMVRGRNTMVDLIELGMVDFDVIMGMDWLYSCYAKLDCQTRTVRFEFPNESVIEWNRGDVVQKGRFIYYLKATKMINMWCLYHLVRVTDTNAEAPTLESMPFVNEFPEGTKYFSKIDLRSVFHQLKITEQDILKTTFRTRYGHFEFLVMSFGVANATSAFVDLINRVFKPFIDSSVIMFIDDILVYSRSGEDHADYLRAVIETLYQHKLYAKFSKYEFWLESVRFLGHVIFREGIKIDPLKIAAVKNWPRPTTPTEIHNFLGLAGTPWKYDWIWAIVDRLTKSAHFLPVKATDTAEQYAQLYIKEIVRLHGTPISIISNRGPQFMVNFWKKFQQGLGTQVNLSTAFHTQTNGQAERTIEMLEDMLHACVLDFKCSWDDHLPLIEFASNNRYHASIQMASFKALYGRIRGSPIRWFDIGEAEFIGPDLMYQAMEKGRLIKERDLEFKEDDWVLLKVSPMNGIMWFVKKGKLRDVFSIIQRIGQVAYRLELPPKMSLVHPVFFVSMLKKVVRKPSLIAPVETIEVNEELIMKKFQLPFFIGKFES
ncbi:uncharacterized protein [Nicotiana tomentosiformis]|uniref:uncharacterized protein n=1 Tax=Nicotiana tomentosiformis TaxID=4098 RepID=UPI00388C831F